MLNSLLQFHKNLFFILHSFALENPHLQKSIIFIADKLDNYVIVFAFITFFFLVYRSLENLSFNNFFVLIKEGFLIFVSVLIAWGVSYLIKITTHMPRPFLRYPNEVHALFPYGGFNSFPSGHATLFMALAVMVYLYQKHLGCFFIFLAVLISLARVVSGVHFPIDIFAGWIIGGGISFVIYRLLKVTK